VSRPHRGIRLVSLIAACVACSGGQSEFSNEPSPYLFVWAGPHVSETAAGLTVGHSPDHAAATGESDFIVVLDADLRSATYGSVLGSRDVGVPGRMAHHTELTAPDGHPLFASDYMTGQIFLLDFSRPLAPRTVARIDSVPGFRRPHSFARRQNGNVIASMQNGDGRTAGDPGGLAEFDPSGALVRTSSARDPRFPGARIRPNGVELMPAIDRIVTTSMPMDDEQTADVVQIWRLSDLRLLHTISMPRSAGDSIGSLPYDARALADGRTAMLNTYYCGLYRLSDLETDAPRIALVHVLRGAHMEGCAVAGVVGHYWVVPSAYGHEMVSLDVADAEHPVEVSTLHTDSTFLPHWIAVDPRSDRLVVTGADEGETRVFIVRIDRATGRLSFDEHFRDTAAARPGVGFDGRTWPHGRVTHVIAHGAVFGRD
jgi:hypothetical protein